MKGANLINFIILGLFLFLGLGLIDKSINTDLKTNLQHQFQVSISKKSDVFNTNDYVFDLEERDEDDVKDENGNNGFEHSFLLQETKKIHSYGKSNLDLPSTLHSKINFLQSLDYHSLLSVFRI